MTGVTLFVLSPSSNALAHNINSPIAISKISGHSNHSSSLESCTQHNYGSGAENNKKSNSSNINQSTRNSIANTDNLNNDSNAINAATRVDYYHTSDSLIKNLLIITAIHSLLNSTTSNDNDLNKDITEEEFKQSVEKLSSEADYLSTVKMKK